MLAIRNLTKTSSNIAARALLQQRSIVSGPPTVRISLVEKILHGIAITVGILAIPFYIATNMKVYNGSLKKEEEGKE